MKDLIQKVTREMSYHTAGYFFLLMPPTTIEHYFRTAVEHLPEFYDEGYGTDRQLRLHPRMVPPPSTYSPS